MNIHTYSDKWAKDIADVFHLSVHSIEPDVYTSDQKHAWAPMPIDYEHWRERLNAKQPFVAIVDDRVAGFIELDPDGHIDCTYTHPDFQGMGVASSLYQYLLTEAKKLGITCLSVEASVVAKPFFERHGFSVVKKNEIQKKGVSLINYSMEIYLSIEPSMPPMTD